LFADGEEVDVREVLHPHVADELVVAAEPVEVLSVGGVVRASCTSGPGRRAGP
jgi:hypothetical protein